MAMHEKPNKHSSFSLLLPFSVLFLFVLFLFFSEAPNRFHKENPAEHPSLPQGKQTYFIQSNPQSPRFIKAVIDPLDVKVGDTQTMEVALEDTEAPIRSLVAHIETDTGTTTQTLALKEGNASKGTWGGSWIVHDTHSKTYRTIFLATNTKNETSSITLTWTDPCTPPMGGDWTLDGNCGISGVNGVDNGNFTVASYTLTINAGSTFVWNPGNSMNITSGAIAIADTAQLKKTYLWMQEGDGDGYPANTTQSASDTAPSGSHKRRYQVSTISSTDCDDVNINAWRMRYGIASCQKTGPHCVGNQTGYYDDPRFYIFLSRFSFGGKFVSGGISSAESYCNSDANPQGNPPPIPLGGAYTAWLADSSSNEPRDRGLAACAAAGPNSLPWYLPDGVTKIADNWADLTDGTIDTVINKTVDYGQSPGSLIWSCVNRDGSAMYGCNQTDCNNWSTDNSSFYGRIGAPGALTGLGWSDVGDLYGWGDSPTAGQPCGAVANHILCVQHAP
jgi:hypothetical protein